MLRALLLIAAIAGAAQAEVSVTALGRVGAFGLYNVDDQAPGVAPVFTEAAPNFGLDVSVDWPLTTLVSLGVEGSALAAAPDGAGERHTILGLHLLARITPPLTQRLSLELVVAGGPTLWPGAGIHAQLDPRLDQARMGFSVRGAAGLVWSLTCSAALVAQLGYAASTSLGQDLAVTHDNATLSFGPRLRW